MCRGHVAETHVADMSRTCRGHVHVADMSRICRGHVADMSRHVAASPCRIDSGWRTIRIFTGIRDYFDVRARQEQPRQHIYDTSSLGKLQDAYFNAHAHVQRTSEAPNGHHATRAAQARHALQTARSRSTPALLHWFSRPLRHSPTPWQTDAARTAYATPHVSRHIDARAADHGRSGRRPPSRPHQCPDSTLLHLPAAPFALSGGNVACEHFVLGLHGRQVIAAGLVVQAWLRGWPTLPPPASWFKATPDTP